MKSTALSVIALMAAYASPALADTRTDVVTNYANIAAAGYEDSAITAKTLQAAVDALIAAPSEVTLQAARQAWLNARVPYMQTEVFRFGNPIVDDWEGKVNAWPLDEGLIDYVDSSTVFDDGENAAATLNVISTPTFQLSGKTVDATVITADLLENILQEADENEANVATGYHAVEFLLWGQDLNGTGAGAGERPYTDYVQGDDCTGGNCDRRGEFLKAATDLLVADLEWMAAQWADGGDARAAVTGDADAAISTILTGMGSLSYGELAGERMRLGIMLNDPEEEHDCFSDNTYNSHYYDALGIQNVYLGNYTRVDGTKISGASLADLVKEADAGLDLETQVKLGNTMRAMAEMKAVGEAGVAYDQMLARGNGSGEAVIMAGVNGLIDQTKTFERIVTALGANVGGFEGSDSLDDPSSVFE